MDVSRIRKLCDELNLSINALEKKANIGRNSVARWEEHPPAIEKVVSVADVLDVSVDYLCGRSKNEGEKISENDRQFLVEFNKLNNESKEHLKQYMQFLANQQKEGK